MNNATQLRVQWEIFPNEDYRECHVNSTLFRWFSSIDRSIDDEFNKEEAAKLTEPQRQLLRDLEGVLGVISVGVEKYSVKIKKGSAFDWDDIAPRAQLIISEWLGFSSVDVKPPLDKYPKNSKGEYLTESDYGW